MADVLYHAMVLLSLRGVKLEEVMQVLRERFSKSGIEEKNSRKSQEIWYNKNLFLYDLIEHHMRGQCKTEVQCLSSPFDGNDVDVPPL